MEKLDVFALKLGVYYVFGFYRNQPFNFTAYLGIHAPWTNMMSQIKLLNIVTCVSGFWFAILCNHTSPFQRRKLLFNKEQSSFSTRREGEAPQNLSCLNLLLVKIILNRTRFLKGIFTFLICKSWITEKMLRLKLSVNTPCGEVFSCSPVIDVRGFYNGKEAFKSFSTNPW